MAKKSQPAVTQANPQLPDFDPAAIYRVKLSKVVKHGSMKLRPSAHSIEVSGAVAIEIKDAIANAERI